MGAQESKAHGPHNEHDDTAVQDYYSILDITQSADQDEIKKAFRRQALIHHPDKNAGDVEAATKRFAAIQQAYEVLSDEQERAWYDSHQASLVPEADATTVLEEVRTGKKSSRIKERGLTVRHLMKFFDASNWSGFDDSDKSFFALYRNLFLRLADEETMWESEVEYSSFGHPDWPWNAPKGQEQAARNFYNQWLSFSTAKDFVWAEQYNLSEAPDRRIRRLIEKENKKARDDAKREYNETIRSLVLFIRKRDPRYKLHLSRNTVPTAGVTTESSIEAARKREQAGQAYVEQSWQRIKIEDIDNAAEWEEAEGAEEWECVACSRTFRSEAAWESHERSRKHLKEVDRLRREMQDENEELNIDDDLEALSGEDVVPDQDDPRVALDDTHEGEDVQDEPPDSPASDNFVHSKGKKKRRAKITVLNAATDELSTVGALPGEDIVPDQDGPCIALDATRGGEDVQDERPDGPAPDNFVHSKSKKKRRAKSTVLDAVTDELSIVGSLEKGQSRSATSDGPTENMSTLDPILTVSSHQQQESQQQMSKRDKRRAREAKKGQADAAHVCNVCRSPFDSRTKLFNHIRDTGHALAGTEEDSDYAGKGQKGRRAKR